jgi:hypothetical protein
VSLVAFSCSQNSSFKVLLENSFIGSTMGLVRGYYVLLIKQRQLKKKPLTITSLYKQITLNLYGISFKVVVKVHDDSDQIQQFSIKKLSVKSHMMLKVRLIYNQWSFKDPIFDRYSFNSDD